MATRWNRYTLTDGISTGYFDTIVADDSDFRMYEASGWMVIWVGVDAALLFKARKSLVCWLYLRETS